MGDKVTIKTHKLFIYWDGMALSQNKYSGRKYLVSLFFAVADIFSAVKKESRFFPRIGLLKVLFNGSATSTLAQVVVSLLRDVKRLVTIFMLSYGVQRSFIRLLDLLLHEPRLEMIRQMIKRHRLAHSTVTAAQV